MEGQPQQASQLKIKMILRKQILSKADADQDRHQQFHSCYETINYRIQFIAGDKR